MRRIEVALDYVTEVEALRSTTRDTAVSERKWQKLSFLAATYLHARNWSGPAARGAGGAGGGFDPDAKNHVRLEELISGI